MEILNNVKNNVRDLPVPPAATASQLERMFEQLRNGGTDESLIRILYMFFSNGNHRDTNDIQYCSALLQAIVNATKYHKGLRLKIKLLQLFVLYGFNEQSLAIYYLDVLTEIRDRYTWEQAENMVRRLLIKISSRPFYHYHPELPTLQETIREHLEEWMTMIEKDKYGFYTLKNGAQVPMFRINVPIPVFMHIVRAMIKTELITLLVPSSQLFRFFSRITRSHKNGILKARTFQNGYVLDQPTNAQKAVRWLKKLRREAKIMYEQTLFSPDS